MITILSFSVSRHKHALVACSIKDVSVTTITSYLWNQNQFDMSSIQIISLVDMTHAWCHTTVYT